MKLVVKNPVAGLKDRTKEVWEKHGDVIVGVLAGSAAVVIVALVERDSLKKAWKSGYKAHQEETGYLADDIYKYCDDDETVYLVRRCCDNHFGFATTAEGMFILEEAGIVELSEKQTEMLKEELKD